MSLQLYGNLYKKLARIKESASRSSLGSRQERDFEQFVELTQRPDSDTNLSTTMLQAYSSALRPTERH